MKQSLIQSIQPQLDKICEILHKQGINGAFHCKITQDSIPIAFSVQAIEEKRFKNQYQ